MIEPTTATMLMMICITGNLAILPLIISFGLIGVMRQIIGWLEIRP